MIFEADELADLQAEIFDVMDEVSPDRFNSFRGSERTRNEDAPEQFVITPTAILEDYPCDYRITNAQERFLAAMESAANLWTVTVPGGINLAEGDELRVLAKGSETEKKLRVKTILKKSNSLKWKVICVDK